MITRCYRDPGDREERRRMLCTIIIKYKRLLPTIRNTMQLNRRNKETLTAALPKIRRPGAQRICRRDINASDKIVADCQDTWLAAGKTILSLGQLADEHLSESDYRSLFNISYSDMKELLRETEGSIFDRIMVSWWAGDTVTLFGMAVFEYMRSTPHGKAMMDEGFEQFIRSTGLTVYAPDRQGKLRPRLKLVKD